jgi:hypothetical protein
MIGGFLGADRYAEMCIKGSRDNQLRQELILLGFEYLATTVHSGFQIDMVRAAQLA